MSLTPTIVSYSRCFHLSPLRTPSDTRFTAACALRILMSSYSDIITANADRSPSTPPVNLRAVYESSEVQVDRWQKEWTELVRKVNGLAEEELELTAIHAKLMVRRLVLHPLHCIFLDGLLSADQSISSLAISSGRPPLALPSLPRPSPPLELARRMGKRSSSRTRDLPWRSYRHPQGRPRVEGQHAQILARLEPSLLRLCDVLPV
jgi:hypothetical protein